MKKLFQIIFILLIIKTPIYAWDLEIGSQRLRPQLTTAIQEYKTNDGQLLTTNPSFNDTIYGTSLFINLVIDQFIYQYETTNFTYNTVIPSSNSIVLIDTSVKGDISEQRLGFYFQQKRELAGYYVGVGISKEEEKIFLNDQNWIFETITPYLKGGIDLIINDFQIRTEQSHYKIGKHDVRMNSLGILYSF